MNFLLLAFLLFTGLCSERVNKRHVKGCDVVYNKFSNYDQYPKWRKIETRRNEHVKLPSGFTYYVSWGGGGGVIYIAYGAHVIKCKYSIKQQQQQQDNKPEHPRRADKRASNIQKMSFRRFERMEAHVPKNTNIEKEFIPLMIPSHYQSLELQRD